MGDPHGLGREGELLAVGHLEAAGMAIVARNWRCRHGEVDIIAREGATLVFCEVKTRRGVRFGTPLGAITAPKQARLRRLVGLYLAEVGGHPGPVRIDAIGILWGPGHARAVEHIRGVA